MPDKEEKVLKTKKTQQYEINFFKGGCYRNYRICFCT